MNSSEPKRWYDQDPALKQALECLSKASDKYQAQIALNIILVIVEHQIETRSLTRVDDLIQSIQTSNTISQQYFRRWYDVNESLRAAMQMLQDCPADVQKKVIPDICRLVEDTLNSAYE